MRVAHPRPRWGCVGCRPERRSWSRGPLRLREGFAESSRADEARPLLRAGSVRLADPALGISFPTPWPLRLGHYTPPVISPSEALAQLLDAVQPLGEVEPCQLAFAAGRILGQRPVSDVDLPPFRKAMMDGFAVRSADLDGPRLEDGSAVLVVVGESKAGTPYDGDVLPGQCVEIYTGAEVPDDCDQVVMIERSARRGNKVHLSADASAAEHVQERAAIIRAGDGPFEVGRRISSVDLSVLAAMGVAEVPVFRQVRVAVLTTGDELVPPWAVPGPGQIREGNTFYLASRLMHLDHEVVEVGAVPDDEELLREHFGAALEKADVVVTTGGVSMGKYDLVGKVFEELGVEPRLHKVAVKPGKPIWFGMRGTTPVLGLPGNPVSAVLGLELFVRPLLAKMAGVTDSDELGERLRRGRWTGPRREAPTRQDNLPCTVRQGDDGIEVLESVAYQGSSDVVGAARATALAVVPHGGAIETGELVRYRPLQ
jgi:molybdopterin molybdotransferase